MEVAPVTFPRPIVLEHHLARRGPMQRESRRGLRGVDEIVVPEQLAAGTDVDGIHARVILI
jgi:hypothetical protein